MGAAGRHTAVERYSWPQVARQLEAYYQHLIAGTPSQWASEPSSLVS
jgi:glycosyltransferase involved in cell wall biosynthesis